MSRENQFWFCASIHPVHGACFCFRKFVCSSYAEELRVILNLDFHELVHLKIKFSTYFSSFLFNEKMEIITNILFILNFIIDLLGMSCIFWKLLCRRCLHGFNVDFCTSICMRKHVFSSFLINEPRKSILMFRINSTSPRRMFLLPEVCL